MNRVLFSICAALLTAYVLSSKKRKTRLHKLAAMGEKVIIFGCSSGIGRNTALSYAKRGAKLILVARRQELLTLLEEECRELGAPLALGIAGDVTCTADMERVIHETSRHFDGSVDTVVYCAGAISVRSFMEVCGIKVKNDGVDSSGNIVSVDNTKGDEADQALRRITDINYFAAVQATRLLLPLLITSSLVEKRQPNLMVVSSMAGRIGAPTRSLYSGSKHAVHGFFDSLRVELMSYNIHVGMVCPGTVDTNLRQSAVDISEHSSSSTEIAGSTKGKLSPQAVADRIILASDAREREVYIPGYYYWALWVARSWIDALAKRKYRQHS